MVDLTKINPSWKEGMFNYATARLLSKGYLVAEKANLPNLVDILRQCWLIVRNKTNNFKQFDYFFCGKVELPNGDMQEVYIEQNETGKFTIMLPEVHKTMEEVRNRQGLINFMAINPPEASLLLLAIIVDISW